MRDRYEGKSQVGNKCVLRLDLKVSSEGEVKEGGHSRWMDQKQRKSDSQQWFV